MRTKREENEFKRGMRVGREQAIRDCAAYVDAWVAYYPASIFPPDHSSKDAWSGSVMREMLPRVAKAIREKVR